LSVFVLSAVKEQRTRERRDPRKNAQSVANLAFVKL
jgi:hypothetical protein